MLRYIEANPLRARVVQRAGKYRWSSFASHGQGVPTPCSMPLRPTKLWQPIRQCGSGWSAYVHQTPDEAELAAIRRSNETGLPYGGRGWVDHLCKQLKIEFDDSASRAAEEGCQGRE